MYFSKADTAFSSCPRFNPGALQLAIYDDATSEIAVSGATARAVDRTASGRMLGRPPECEAFAATSGATRWVNVTSFCARGLANPA